MKILVLDVETTTLNKGSPFHPDNVLCLVGLHNELQHSIYDIEYTDTPYGDSLKDIKSRIESVDLLVGFNIKFDIHWLRRYIPDLVLPQVWDCQLGEFILSHQTKVMPSLDESCEEKGLGTKDPRIKDYWEKGIDTRDIPWNELMVYLKDDLQNTLKLYEYQLPKLKDNKVFQLQCMDLPVLQEMEWNGMLYNLEESKHREEETLSELALLDKQLFDIFPIDGINFNSTDHVSYCLFGGSIPLVRRIATERILKDGTIRHGSKKGIVKVEMPRLVEPDPDSETLKKGVYSVDKSTLRKLAGSKQKNGKLQGIIESLQKRAIIETLTTKYFSRLPLLCKMDRGNCSGLGTINGQFNQCVAVTGRLSSSKPNLQNFAEEVKPLFVSRYGDYD